jgi:protein phosphatase PTC1
MTPQLWDVCTDQEAVDLVREIQEPVAAAKLLVDHALAHFSTDNLSCMIIRFDKSAILTNRDNAIGVEGDQSSTAGKVSEVDKIVGSTKQKIAEGVAPPVGVSASNSGRGHDPLPTEEGGDAAFVPTTIEGSVEEEPSSMSDDSPETTPDGSVTTIGSEASKPSKPSPGKPS